VVKFDTNWNLSSIAPASIGFNTHNWNPTDLDKASLIWITPTSSLDLTGLAGGEERRVMFLGLRSSGSFSVTIPANSASSTAANRFADAIVMNASGGGKIVTAWMYLGGIWRRWRF
jgi:hypothetical protein